jgi:broad specificity phosphatase PhoE
VSAPALILVRHARPQIEPDSPPPSWRLSDEGRAAAQALAGKLAHLRPAAFVASTEPKAIETAEILARASGLPVTSDPAFDEHRRDAWPFEADPAAVTARVVRALTERAASIEGAEPGDVAAQRFAAGLAKYPARPLLVASHGTVLGLFLAAHFGLNPVELWRGLALPEAFVLDADGRLIARIAAA